MTRLTRRRALAALAPVLGGAAAVRLGGASALGAEEHAHSHLAEPSTHSGHAGHDRGLGAGHPGFRAGSEVDHAANGFHPTELLRDFDEGRTSRLPNGRTLREFELVSGDKEIEVAPGVKYAAWAYNGRVPGPALRAREGDRLRIRFVNGSAHPHTVHFHGLHPAPMDGIPGVGKGLIRPGEIFTYEFDAAPFGLHLYHCHTAPLADHIAKGLYGAFVIDPRDGRPDADELVMVMNAFDTDFDRSNEIYAVNTVGFGYMQDPVVVRRGELVRIYLVNVTEFDVLNSFHVHGNFFDYFPTGTSLKPVEHTDTIMQCQGQRGILELRFPDAGRYMFHAHQSEFAELGWMGFFEVRD